MRKHIERASTDPRAVITTYEGKHNHDVPAARSSSHSIASASVSSSGLQNRGQNTHNQASLNRTDFGSRDHRAAAVLQLKEENDIT